MRSNQENLETALVVKAQYDKRALLAELADRFAAGDHTSEEAQANVYRLEVLAEAEQDAADARAAERRPLTHRQITSLGATAIAASARPRSLSGEECLNVIIPLRSMNNMLKDKGLLPGSDKEIPYFTRIKEDSLGGLIPDMEHNIHDRWWLKEKHAPGRGGSEVFDDPWTDPHQPIDVPDVPIKSLGSLPPAFIDLGDGRVYVHGQGIMTVNEWLRESLEGDARDKELPATDSGLGDGSIFGRSHSLESESEVVGNRVFVDGLGWVRRDAYERGDYSLPTREPYDEDRFIIKKNPHIDY